MKFLSCSRDTLFYISALLLLFCSAKAVITLPENETVPALIVFGDSIVDPGNNNNLNTAIKCNFPPYGRDFKEGIPTGRFCNGKIPSDLFVEELGLKELLPAYLDPNLQPEDLLTGVSFASGACGYDPLTPKLVSVISLTDQLEMFKEYKGKLKGLVGEERTNLIIEKSIFLVVAGTDDLANTYYTFTVRKNQYDVPSYTDLMVNSASSFFKELYGLGARRIGVLNVPPFGCLPAQRTVAGGIQRQCVESYNQAAELFNTKLSSLLDFLNNNLPHVRMVYLDSYKSVLDIVHNPQIYGFSVESLSCCGTGTIEILALCNQVNPFTCNNVSNYVFWDSYHPTEKAYKTIFIPVIQKNINSFF